MTLSAKDILNVDPRTLLENIDAVFATHPEWDADDLIDRMAQSFVQSCEAGAYRGEDGERLLLIDLRRFRYVMAHRGMIVERTFKKKEKSEQSR